MQKIWDPRHECMPRPELRELQLQRLRSSLRHLYESVPFYRQMLRETGFTPDSVSSLDDLTRLPFTTKRDLRDNYPFGLLAVSPERVVRFQASGGTTGKPTVPSTARPTSRCGPR